MSCSHADDVYMTGGVWLVVVSANQALPTQHRLLRFELNYPLAEQGCFTLHKHTALIGSVAAFLQAGNQKYGMTAQHVARKFSSKSHSMQRQQPKLAGVSVGKILPMPGWQGLFINNRFATDFALFQTSHDPIHLFPLNTNALVPSEGASFAPQKLAVLAAAKFPQGVAETEELKKKKKKRVIIYRYSQHGFTSGVLMALESNQRWLRIRKDDDSVPFASPGDSGSLLFFLVPMRPLTDVEKADMASDNIQNTHDTRIEEFETINKMFLKHKDRSTPNEQFLPFELVPFGVHTGSNWYYRGITLFSALQHFDAIKKGEFVCDASWTKHHMDLFEFLARDPRSKHLRYVC